MSTGFVRRPLTAKERRIIDRLLSVDLSGVEELRRQLDDAEVTGVWGEADPSIDIWVPENEEYRSVLNGLLPVDATVAADDGTYAGEFLLWVKDGRISGLEYAWVTDEDPRELPDADVIHVSVRSSAPDAG